MNRARSGGGAPTLAERKGLLKRLIPLLAATLLMGGCGKIDLMSPRVAAPAAPDRPVITAGMSSMEVVRQIGLPVNGATLESPDGPRTDIWVYDGGVRMLIFENGKLKKVVGATGERSSIRLYR